MSTRFIGIMVLLVLVFFTGIGRLVAAESPYLFGIHDHDPIPGEYVDHIRRAVPGGWDTATVAVGHDPNDNSGVDFSWFPRNNMTVICRINNGYWPNGTIPLKENYADFAKRCANFVRNSQGCNIWVIGNELNIAGEWPARNGRLGYVSPTDYADCFRQCYDAIKAVSPSNKVLSAPSAPFSGPFGGGSVGGIPNDSNPLNWVDYEHQELAAIMATGPLDGIALHVYSRGYLPSDVTSTTQRLISGKNLYWSFYCYKDWIDYGIPSELYNLPAYITECDGYYCWRGGHPESPNSHYESGWMQEVYREIDSYNRTVAFPQNKPVIRCVNMYRWCCCYDGWNIDGDNPWKGQMLSDLDAAMSNEYSWPGAVLVVMPWSDAFNSDGVDGEAPEPEWVTTSDNGGSVQENGGYLKLKGAAGSSSPVLVKDSKWRVYKDFVIDTKLLLADTTPTTGTTGNAEIRFRTDVNGVGYALAFNASGGSSTISLKRTDTGEVIQGKEINYSLPTGAVLYPKIKADGQTLTIQVGTTSGGSDVVNWVVTDSTFPNKGCFWLVNNQLMEVDFDYFNYQPSAAGIQGVVKDSFGNTMPGVTVKTNTGGYTASTDSDGKYLITNVTPGTYNVTASKTNYASQTASNVILSAGTVTTNFTITDNTKPSLPVITDAGAYQTSSDTITCSWTPSSDPESGVVEYRVAISKTTSQVDLITGGAWVTLPATTLSHTRTGLSLVNGQTYYILLKSRNGANIVSNQATSDGIKVAKGVAGVGKAKAEADGKMVALDDRIVTANLSDCMYVEDPDRSAGVKVAATGVAEGTMVDVAGFLSTVNGERQISGYAIIPGEAGHDLGSYWLANRDLFCTGTTMYTPLYTPPSMPGAGLSNIGMLVTTSGKVMDSGTGYFTLRDGMPKNVAVKVTVPSGVTPPTTNQFVVVTGINTVEAGTLSPVVRVRRASDIRVVQ